MKRIFIAALVLVSFITGCNDSDRNTDADPENDIDAARSFIRAALDGDHEKARTFLVNDTLNQQYLDMSERLYDRMSPEEKNEYRGSSIRFFDKKVVDSVTSIVYFSNSYRNQRDSLKVIKTGDKWLIDFKFIFNQQPDSLR